MPATMLKEFLDKSGVEYSSILHSPAYTAQDTAHSAHISGHLVAKTVIVKIDGKMAMTVLPADRKIALQDLRDVTGCEDVKFAMEGEFKELFPDCEVGAMPPFGNLYGLDVYVAPELAAGQQIAFNAGTHTELIKMGYADFERLVQPKVMSFAF